MTTYNSRVLVLDERLDQTTGDSIVVGARTVDSSLSLLGQASLVPYQVIGPTPDSDIEIEINPNMIGSLIVDGEPINGATATVTALQGLVWSSAAGPQSTTILVLSFDVPDSPLTRFIIFTTGGTPLPEFSTAAEFDAFFSTITSFGAPIHDPGPLDSIDMLLVPGVTTTEDDYINVRQLGPTTANLPGGLGSDTYDFTGVTGTYAYTDYSDLAGPITVTLDGTAETGSVVKQGAGTDSYVDLGNALGSGWFTTDGGFAIAGTNQNDVFTASVNEDWIEFAGGGGNDTYNLNLSNVGIVRLSYEFYDGQNATSGIVVDLNTGVMSNDGYGGVDQINVTNGSGRIEINATRLTDNITGTSASERFILLGGNDTLDAGEGFDLVRYDRSGISAVNVDLEAGTATGSDRGTAFTHTLSGVEAIRGSRAGDDTITGNDAANTLDGIGGNDIIHGGLGNDSLYGRDGNDTLFGGAGDDLLEGDAGTDRMDGGDGADVYVVDALDLITDTGTSGFDQATVRDAGGVNLAVGAWRGVERIIGFTGNDTIDATGSVRLQSLMGAAGNDVLTGSDFNDQLFGGNGDDTLYGGAGNDLLAGAAGVDVIHGGAGNETLVGGAGLDILDGGEGFDLYMMDDQDQITDTGTVGFDRVQIAVSTGLSLAVGGWTGVERINGLTGNDTIDATGSDQVQSLLGNDGDDHLIGGNANDQLIGGNGNDLIDGGTGNDLLIGSSGADTMNAGAGNDTLIGGPGPDVLDGGDGSDLYMITDQDQINDSGTSGFDRAQIGVTTGLSLAVGGWTGIERINGLTGNDTIDATGSDQDQSLLGNDGDDHLIGGNANDQLIGGNGNDLIDGWTGNDLLIGNGGADTMNGGAGNDTLIGGTGLDVLDGGEGNDLYMISDQDQITDTGAGGFDRGQIAVSSGLSLAIGGWSGIERVSGLSGNDTISAVGATTDLTLDGGDGNDVLTGGSGNDSLFGGNGADRLIGGTGDDFIVGGDGADVFVFATGFGNDALRDFANGSDLIDLSGHEGITAFSDLTLTQAGAHVVIEVTGTTDSITVLNTSVAVLGAEDFIFA